MSEQAAPPPLHGLELTMVALALALGTFMQVLDSTIANVSLQTIAGNLGESSDTATWVITAFAMANGVTVPLTGWFMRRFGVVTTFTTSVALFTVASGLCGIAWSLPSLVIFRLLQGAVSGPMIPGSQALLMAVFPPEKRNLALSIWSMTALIGPVMGPILGGYISDHYHWGWIFLINVPIGFLTVGALITKLRPYNTAPMKLPIDVVGLALLITWVGTLQVVLDLGNDRDWFNNQMIVAMAIISGIAFIAWIIWELTEENPAVDLTLFKGRNFALGTICFTLGYACFFANNLLMPLWLQTQQGYTATWAGLVAAPAGVVSVLISPINARLSSKIDIRWLASFSLGAFGVSFLMRTGFTSDTDLWHYILPILVQGLAMGVFFISMTTICIDKLPPHRIPAATGLTNFARITGGGFAASATTTFWDHREILHQSRLAEAANLGNPAYNASVTQMQGMGIDKAHGLGVMTQELIHQAYTLSSIDIFYISGIGSLVMMGLVWFTRRPAPATGPVAAD
ncbi:DHA2 family efflux MFS transporter permease subunit [Novosphingobium terrae]|uniref:DHA2 family efflux MFS transporter permease subunit n=1 Tax=Novosphingobium terrae TaxID=2726189 RepID=UPI001980B6D6|nr:DHA2 family efflux MFS transporter permease subunit [Novosphingobium terrae]